MKQSTFKILQVKMEQTQLHFLKPFFIILSLLIVILTANAQNPLKAQKDALSSNHLSPYPYGLDKEWSNEIFITEISPDGNWVAFTEFFPRKSNILHLNHSSKKINYNLPEGTTSKFSKNNKWFGSISDHNEFVLVDLVKHELEHFKGVGTFDYSYSGNHLAFLQKFDDGKSILKVRNLENNQEQIFEDIIKFIWNPQKTSLLAINKEKSNITILLIDAVKKTSQIIKNNLYKTPSFLKWNNTGTTAVIISEKDQNQELEVYNLNEDVITSVEALIKSDLKDYEISNKEPFISDDGKKVMFYRKKRNQKLPTEDKLEIWNTTDPILYPLLKIHTDYINPFLLTVWYPKKGIIAEIETEEFPSSSMDLNHDFALIYNELQYGPESTEFPHADLYIKDIISGMTKKIVEQQSLQVGLSSISPSGKYITYFRDKHWWVYNIQNNKTNNITKDLNAQFQDIDNEYPIERIEVYSKPAWTQNDEKILLTDKNDLWVMQPDGKNAKRLTNGKETNNQYRLNDEIKVENTSHLTIGILSSIKLDIEKGQLLKRINYNTQNTGISLLKPDYSVSKLLYENNNLSRVYMPTYGNNLIYYSENTTSPTTMNNYDITTKKTNLIFQTNKELLKYDLGQKSLISYNVYNKELIGALVYPANFDPLKKYPMIVSIYEKTSRKAMGFYPPNGFSYQGFSLLSYTTSGYFVLYPDISYQNLKPGISALECVNAAIDKAIENENIDKDKIGLIRHSFGGYESAFIATQTNRFAAIVAGAAVTDLTSHYHGVNWNHLSSDAWRYEDQQWRMGLSYYDNKKAYLENSPLEFVENVITPILLWTGDKDYQITWTQSLEMFIALKRLKKNAKLVLVKDESHSVEDNDKEQLLSMEIKKWFDMYCK